MRSDLVFGAIAQISNRYHLCRLASKAARRFHVPKARLQDTTNDVLVLLRGSLPGTRIRPESPHSQRRRAHVTTELLTVKRLHPGTSYEDQL
jgi:hypothetical protein